MSCLECIVLSPKFEQCSINAVHAMQHCMLQLPYQKQRLHPKAQASLPEIMLNVG